MISDRLWDVALNPTHDRGRYTRVAVHLPVPLARALLKARYGRVLVKVVEEGILLKPYRGPQRVFGRPRDELELPAEWDR